MDNPLIGKNSNIKIDERGFQLFTVYKTNYKVASYEANVYYGLASKLLQHRDFLFHRFFLSFPLVEIFESPTVL
jgi:hypothetical protein